MEPNGAMPQLGVPMPAEYRYYGYTQPKPPGGLAIAAALLIGLVAVTDVLSAAANLTGQFGQELRMVSIGFLATIVAAVLFITWLWRVRSNVDAVVGPQTQRLGKGWAIGAWICPIVSYWFPYQYVIDVWRASSPDRAAAGNGLVLFWWLTFLLSNQLSLLLRLASTRTPWLGLVGDALQLAAAVLAILVIRRITAWQTGRP
ncbi:DUF4328 domain-containing protein [Kutzneria sp. CA-103260]|uniref:DUF4328 domain-containing protein n=1 Tax=Kutzneria sp. CA-103260 TaxID=2802641 RepID=UPI001BA78691|nr:DUF4328 domain-containing protein [Kutzneria sp. CA-103260]QUQ71902.1 hypothetical protein JJ691_96890 [Kutzneria sp. CA-103260]